MLPQAHDSNTDKEVRMVVRGSRHQPIHMYATPRRGPRGQTIFHHILHNSYVIIFFSACRAMKGAGLPGTNKSTRSVCWKQDAKLKYARMDFGGATVEPKLIPQGKGGSGADLGTRSRSCTVLGT